MANFEEGSSPEFIGKLARKNLDVIRERYGDGVSESKREGDLEYHNELHTLEVMRATKTLIRLWNEKSRRELEREKLTGQPPSIEPITEREETLLEIAASGHDRVQNARELLKENFKHGSNERMSADEVAADMRAPGSGFSEKDIAFVRACILGTIPEFLPDRLLQPMAETKKMLHAGEITEYQFELAKLLADADLASFGQGLKVFGDWSVRLFKEMKRDPKDFTEFLKYEISILQNHVWLSKIGQEAFPDKQESIGAMKKMLEAKSTV